MGQALASSLLLALIHAKCAIGMNRGGDKEREGGKAVELRSSGFEHNEGLESRLCENEWGNISTGSPV